MLATQLLPQSPFGQQYSDDAQRRPAKDADAFNALLPPAIEFVEGSSTGALAVPESKYPPINVPTPQVRRGRLVCTGAPADTMRLATETRSLSFGLSVCRRSTCRCTRDVAGKVAAWQVQGALDGHP
jgi:ubiquitin carboxyl-terminal hydrolase 36/42